ncbi:MAG: 4a-hydroxytetrahydrobiopterin dehydratase [Woeseiaceae bacterium]|jgi:4a-hydroxytetrahydrobiopterin dehydratase|tara:strand:+ start:338 stop:634 length:297 start_codon:yes stop_codon:yes gene_type:complete
MIMSKLNKKEILIKLKENNSWSYEDSMLKRIFVFSDFIDAFKFMTLIALEAERMDHHPEWSNIYNKVIVNLVTHEVSGVTEKDFILAKSMDKVANIIL